MKKIVQLFCLIALVSMQGRATTNVVQNQPSSDVAVDFTVPTPLSFNGMPRSAATINVKRQALDFDVPDFGSTIPLSRDLTQVHVGSQEVQRTVSKSFLSGFVDTVSGLVRMSCRHPKITFLVGASLVYMHNRIGLKNEKLAYFVPRWKKLLGSQNAQRLQDIDITNVNINVLKTVRKEVEDFIVADKGTMWSACKSMSYCIVRPFLRLGIGRWTDMLGGDTRYGSNSLYAFHKALTTCINDLEENNHENSPS